MLKFLKTKSVTLAILAVATFFLLGIYIGSHKQQKIDETTSISNKETPVEITADFEPFWKVWNVINEKYPQANKVSDEERINGSISGLVGSLNDPYSVFFDPSEKEKFEEDISGSFSGIGMEVGIKDKILTIIAPLKDTPAYKANLKSGDKILKIDDKISSDLTIDEAINFIRGERGTTVTLTIFREGERDPQEIKVVRDTINVPTLDSELRKDGVFVIRLYSFTANSSSLFRDALGKFYEAKTDKLIIDLRGNPGGYLDTAIDISSWFLPAGKIVAIEDYGNGKKQKIYRSLGYNMFNDKLKLVILIDGGSASASEIVAGAMKDHDRAILVGSQSYGKGSIQEVVDITPSTVLKITVAKWLTPNGTSISEKGLMPDYKIEITEKDFEEEKDPQMEKAVELLLNWK
ncbi:S41 family peptidase [Patescibacteria group bacterium]|nr:S41 family peptidase [Patescibacteria group bacterium]MBU1727757.1 S41 family peptidase [Patescibacteria group bacterium]